MHKVQLQSTLVAQKVGGGCPCRLTVSPNGVAWAPHEARAGVVPRLLQEILKTRIMVKAAMKRHPASAKVLLLTRRTHTRGHADFPPLLRGGRLWRDTAPEQAIAARGIAPCGCECVSCPLLFTPIKQRFHARGRCSSASSTPASLGSSSSPTSHTATQRPASLAACPWRSWQTASSR